MTPLQREIVRRYVLCMRIEHISKTTGASRSIVNKTIRSPAGQELMERFHNRLDETYMRYLVLAPLLNWMKDNNYNHFRKKMRWFGDEGRKADEDFIALYGGSEEAKGIDTLELRQRPARTRKMTAPDPVSLEEMEALPPDDKTLIAEGVMVVHPLHWAFIFQKDHNRWAAWCDTQSYVFKRWLEAHDLDVAGVFRRIAWKKGEQR